jgi:phage-related protein
MASAIPPILVQLQADVTQLKAGLAQAEAAIKGVDDKVKVAGAGMGKFTTQMKSMATTIGLAFGGAQIANFAKESVMAASNLNEAMSKVGVVFGDNAKEIETWAKSSTANFGMSERAALTSVGTFGNLFSAFGLGEEDTKKFSTSLTELAVDMASFNDMPVDDALNALRSGLSGETEPMKKFGSVLSETRLKTEALTLGLIKNTKEALDPAAKAQAAYSLIMKDTAVQQGDYDRTAGGTANTMRRVAAEMDNAKVAIGQGLLPVFDGLLKVLEKGIVPALKKFGEFLKNNQDVIIALGIGLAVATAAFVAYKAIIIASTTASKLFAVAQVLMSGGQLASIASTNTLAASILRLNAVMRANPIGLVVTAVALLVAGFVLLWKKSDTFRSAVITVAKVALTAFASIIPMVGKVYEAIMKVVLGPLKAMLTVLSKLPGVGKFAKAGLDIMNKGLDGISDFADGAAKKAKELAANLDKMGKAAEKSGDKVDKATKGKGGKGDKGGGKGTGVPDQKTLDKIKKYQKDVQDIYKDMNDVAAEANEKMLEAAVARDEKIAEANERYQERVADANKAFTEAEADAKEDNAKRLIDITKDYNKKTLELKKDLDAKIADLEAKAADKSADLRVKALEKQASIVKQSMDRLRNAFASKTGFSLADAFGMKEFGGAATGDQLLASMKQRLNDVKNLAEKAAFLQANGFSQTFIEQVVSAGPEVGNKLADSILNASPESIKELQSTFNDLEKTSNSGLDVLAQTMNAGGKLATDELREAYSQVAVDLKASLAEVDSQLQVSLAEANKVYEEAMSEAKIARDERAAESVAQMNEQIANAKKRLDEALADAQKDLNKALIEAQVSYQKAIDEIQKATEKKLADLKAKLAEVAAAMAALGAQQAAFAAMQAAPVYTFSGKGGSGGGLTGGSSTTVNNNTTVNAFTNATPSTIATAVTNAAKFSAPVTVYSPSVLASKESGAIGAASIAAQMKAAPKVAQSLSAKLRDR